MTAPAATSTFRADIQGLRAIAVLAVVFFHFGVSTLRGGFVGVDVFFVISGYLITQLLVVELQATGSVDLRRFYGRRARRLIPAALLVIAATLLTGVFVLSPAEQGSAAKSAGAFSLYISNFWLMRQTFDYFAAESTLNPFLHSWSLAVEEQFYLIWPAMLLLAHKVRPGVRSLAVVMGGITVASFALCYWATKVNQPLAFYGSPMRAWEFGVGGLAALPAVTHSSTRSRLGSLPAAIGAVLLTCSLFVIHENLAFPGVVALLPVAATVLLLIPGRSDGAAARILGSSPMRRIGDWSYSIYLWHWPVIVYARILYPDLSWLGQLVCFVLTLVLAIGSYRYVEDPLRKNSWLSKNAFRSLGLGLTLSGAGATLAGCAWLAGDRFAKRPDQQAIVDTANEPPITGRGDRKCLASFTQAQPLRCDFGPETSGKTLVLFGDSHADQWSSPLVTLAESHGFRLVTYLKASCSVSEIPIYNIRLRRESPECKEWRERAIGEIVALRPSAVVVTQFSSGYVHGAITRMGEHAVDIQTWKSGLGRSLQKLAAAGAPLVLLRDTPTPSVNVKLCLSRSAWRGQNVETCSVPLSEAIDDGVTASEKQVALAHPNVTFLDLTAEFCDGAVCPARRRGITTYRDGNHMTTAFARSLAPALERQLIPLLAR